MKSVLFILLPTTALLYVPLYLEEFEQPKAFALVTFGCFMAFWVNWRQILKDRVAQVLVLFVASAALSAIYSIDHHISIFGNPKCPNGLLVILSYVVVYLAASQFLRTNNDARRA